MIFKYVKLKNIKRTKGEMPETVAFLTPIGKLYGGYSLL